MNKTLSKLICTLALCSLNTAHAAEPVMLSTDAIINLPALGAWSLFTSEDGLKSIGFADAKVQLQLGGAYQASGGQSKLGAFVTQIVSLDPEHMLSFKSNDGHWQVLYFNAMGDAMTQLKWLEFFPESERASVAAHQQQIRALFNELIYRYAPECHVCKEERERKEREADALKNN